MLRQVPGYDPFVWGSGYRLDHEAAQRAIDFFAECLTHVEGAMAGSPFVLEEWQQAIVGNLFGWKRPDGSRRFREVLLYIPRKNGKTPLAAGIAACVLYGDPEKGQQNVCAAADTEQASYLFRQIKGMVDNEPELAKRSEIYGGLGHRAIIVPASNSSLKVISSDANTKHGGNLSLGLIDELHAQPNRELVDVLQTSMASQNRRHPLLVLITTADFDRPSICNEKYDYACRVRDNGGDPAKPGYDPAFLPVVYEAPRDADWTSEGVWAKANPNLGVSVSLDYLRRECKRAQDTPSYQNTFRRLHLNQRTEQDVRWLDLDRWDLGNAAPPADLKGRECWAGLDLSSTTDLTALVLAFPDGAGGYDVLPHFWAPRENARQRERRDRVPYQTWIEQGYIEATEGDVVDYEAIRQKLLELREQYAIRQVGADPWNATQLINQLQGDGFEVVAFRQGFASLSAPSKELEKLVMGGKLRHGGNPVLRWMAGNVAVEQDPAGNIKPSKRRSTERIDGIVATIEAIGVHQGQPVEQGSVYDQRDPIIL